MGGIPYLIMRNQKGIRSNFKCTLFLLSIFVTMDVKGGALKIEGTTLWEISEGL